jgi:hypothetical protein
MPHRCATRLPSDINQRLVPITSHYNTGSSVAVVHIGVVRCTQSDLDSLQLLCVLDRMSDSVVLKVA